MNLAALSEAVARSSDACLTLGEVPLDELLLAVHTGRLTGAVRIGEPPESDRLCFRGGSFVGLRPRPSADGTGFRAAVQSLRRVSSEALAALGDDGALEPRSLARALIEGGACRPADIDKAVTAHVMRRLFALYDLAPSTSVAIQSGLDHVAGFWPVAIDVLPVVAFGMVVRAAPRRRREVVERVRGRRIRLLAPYDDQRNSYGLPPAVVLAMKSLEGGIRVSDDVVLPHLSSDESAGLLLLLDRMALLHVD